MSRTPYPIILGGGDLRKGLIAMPGEDRKGFNLYIVWLKKEFPQIRKKLWEETFWSQSFCLLTAGGAPIETIRKYIESQGEK